MAMEKMEILIGTDGEVQLEYDGVKGKACMDATEQVEQLIGDTKEQKKTGDYYKGDGPRKNWRSNY
jgi:hypothetical protein